MADLIEKELSIFSNPEEVVFLYCNPDQSQRHS
jgi:hypothetical protein